MALSFNGTTASLVYPVGMFTPIANGFSGACWINLSGAADVAASSRTILYFGTTTTAPSDHNFHWRIGDHTDADNTTQVFGVRDGGVQTDIASTTHLELYGWHHVAFTYDGANVRFYLDGAPDGSPAFTAAGDVDTAGRSFRVAGAYDLHEARLFDGRMAGPAYWQRVLTPGEVWLLARGANGISIPASPLQLSANLKFYATLYSADAADGGIDEFVRNQVDGVAATVAGPPTTSSARNNPPLGWQLARVVSSHSDGHLYYTTPGTYAQIRAGTSSGNGISDNTDGASFDPWGQAGSAGPTGTFAALSLMTFGADRHLPRDAFIETVSFFWHCFVDNNFTSTELCEVREYEWGNENLNLGEKPGILSLSDWIPNDNLGNYTLLATKVFSGGLQEGPVYMESEPIFRERIKRDKPTQIVMCSDRQRLAITPSDDETVHPYYAERTTSAQRPMLYMLYRRMGQFDRQEFPKRGLRRALQPVGIRDPFPT